MKHLFNFLVPIALLCCAVSCEKQGGGGGVKQDAAIESALVGEWEYTIDIWYSGTNYDTMMPVTGEKIFKGTFTWDENLYGNLDWNNKPLSSYMNGGVENGQLEIIGDSLIWTENGEEYEVFCTWDPIAVTKKTKEFSVYCGEYSWIEITYPDGSEMFTNNIIATITAKKIK